MISVLQRPGWTRSTMTSLRETILDPSEVIVSKAIMFSDPQQSIYRCAAYERGVTAWSKGGQVADG